MLHPQFWRAGPGFLFTFLLALLCRFHALPGEITAPQKILPRHFLSGSNEYCSCHGTRRAIGPHRQRQPTLREGVGGVERLELALVLECACE